jgi:hypothetical protein
MRSEKELRCDCGYRLRAQTEPRQVAEVRRHAWEAHGIDFSADQALAVLLRLELEVDETESALVTSTDETTRRREQP